MTRDPHIARLPALAARIFQLIYPAMQRLFFASPELEFATKTIEQATIVTIPTRHGDIRALVFAPTDEDIAVQRARGERPPVHLLTHGGAFILQYPREEGNVARYLASEVGCYVVIPDYKAAPQVRFPVAEEQCFDALNWVRAMAESHGWDGSRITVGGPSAGGKLALSVALLTIDAGGCIPLAVTSEYGCADMSRTNDQRISAKKNPIVGPALMDLVFATYYKDTDLKSPDVSPIFHPALGKLPPTLILTAEHDTLRHESNDLAVKLKSLGVDVTYREFAGVDHGFTHQKPVEVAKAAITMIGDHLKSAYRSDRAIQPGRA